MNTPSGDREIPYNYTSFSDREIIIRFLGQEMWDLLNQLRGERKTGRSARMLFEVLGDLWIVTRNPLLQDDLMANPKRLNALIKTMKERLARILDRVDGNPHVPKLVTKARQAVEKFAQGFVEQKKLREQITRQLSRVSHQNTIDFSAIARVSQMTDATDWRVACPAVVLSPKTEIETADLVAICIDLGLTIIPRGGGTGYTGSGVPLYSDTAIINLERLDTIGIVNQKTTINGVNHPVATLRVESGAVTKHVSDVAERSGYVFAVDPTSQNASTIGGNIAMNAGGKKAVLWGTTLDNLVSWRMVTPDATWLEVERLDHNLGKIHDIPVARFQVSHFLKNGKTLSSQPELLTIPSSDFRKPGLGKDVTNKRLGGLPGIQKEGCDGLITSAVFLLHPMPSHTYTVCLEFYGADLGDAVPAIVEIKKYLDLHKTVGCAGLEHLDERYIRAVGYNSKAFRQERPKMVLLADIVGEEESTVSKAANHVKELALNRGGEGFIAISKEGRKRFWSDRSRTAAIAAHTNAFKVNEDIVIPLERLADYNQGIERLNIEQSMSNKVRIVQSVRQFLEGSDFFSNLPAGFSTSTEGKAIIEGKKEAALQLLDRVGHRWQTFLDHLDTSIEDLILPLEKSERVTLLEKPSLIQILLRRDLIISYRKEVATPLKNLFGGDLWLTTCKRLDAIHASIRVNRLFIALHMHAGDGNVHTNIPVNSNDYAMLKEADRLVECIMSLTLSLGGRISGEHGIGLTKFRFLDAKIVADFKDYKNKIDPKGHFNRGKLLPESVSMTPYTPSLRLVQQEALILKESALEALNDDIRHCLRCGKCKAVCSTHVPRANLLYSPRNKILAAGLIVEAFLYEEQTHRGVSLNPLDEMVDLAEHCTICHRCSTPCPVDIDFGLVTIRMRELLKSRGVQSDPLAKQMALAFLTTTDSRTIRFARKAFIQWGYAAQRLGYKLTRSFDWMTQKGSPAITHGPPSLKTKLIHLLKKPLPEISPSVTARTFLDMESTDMVSILKPSPVHENPLETVFYFPGCGCERLFSDISLATLAMLRHSGTQTVLPPGYLCCGFPQASSGEESVSRQITIGNRVLFHRVANALSDLEIKTVLVSCGTCLSQLETYAFQEIFPGSRLMDIHEYLMEKGVQSQPEDDSESFLFHDPCHSPMKHYDPIVVANTLLGLKGQLTDRCCGEAGTFAVARPDIASQVRFRKEMELPSSSENTPPIKLYTSCPSCYQGLARQRKDIPMMETHFMVVTLAEQLLGKQWRTDLLQGVKQGGVERVLL